MKLLRLNIPQEIPPVSVVIASFDNTDILELTLASLACQSSDNFQVIIADDGSNEDYAPVLKKWACSFRYGIQHVKHENRGFRKTRILNRAVITSRFERLIFIDMDCLLHRHFIKNHLAYLEKGIVITGRRVDVMKEVLRSPEEIVRDGLGLSLFRLFKLRILKKAERIECGFFSPVFYQSANNTILGSNFSIFKSDLEAVNGFNEEYIDVGIGEDTDIDFRLKLNGIKVKNLRNKVIQYHIHHHKSSRDIERNWKILERTKRNHEIRAKRGLAEVGESDFFQESFI